MNGWVVFGTVIGYTAIVLAIISGIVCLWQKVERISILEERLNRQQEDIRDLFIITRKLTPKVDHIWKKTENPNDKEESKE